MEAKVLRDKNPKELREELENLGREYFQLRMAKASGQFIQSHLFKHLRKNIARVKTILREKS